MRRRSRGINDAIDEGTVRNIGVNNLSLKQLKRACEVSKHPVRAAQIHYSLWYKDDLSDEMRSYCEEKKITVVAFKPLERCRKLADGVPGILREMADKYDRSVHQVALNWIIRQKNIVTIPKALNPDHIKDNIEAAEFLHIRRGLEETFRVSRIQSGVADRVLRIHCRASTVVGNTLNDRSSSFAV